MSRPEFIEKFLNWLQNLKEEEKAIEVVSFYNELPIRTKIKVLDLDKKRGVIEWNTNPRLNLAIGESKRFFSRFFDKNYKENRIVGLDVLYFSENFIETTFPKFVIEPKLNREYLRVTTSEKLPVIAEAKEEKGNKEYLSFKVLDICEGGIGALVNKGLFKVGDKLTLKLIFPNKKEINLEGEVVNVKDLGKVDKVGIKFLNPHNRVRNVLNRYVMDRQREIMNKIRLLAD